MSRLLATPGGLPSALANGNHLLFLLAYLEDKRSLIKSKGHSTTRFHGFLHAANAAARFQRLAELISTTRTSLRLLGLFPMYAWLRRLISERSRSQSKTVYIATLSQCAASIVFQSMENLAFLMDRDFLPVALIARWSNDVRSVYRLAYRAWLAAILCGLARILAEALLWLRSQDHPTATEKQSAEQTTFNWREKVGDVCATIGWMPVATHCSLPGGLPCFNTGLLGISGLVADLNALQVLWDGTK